MYYKVQYHDVSSKLVLCVQTGNVVPSGCILLHPIYHRDKTGVVYSKRCSIVLCLCILLYPIYHRYKTGVVYSKRCSVVLCLCILLYPIYHNDKTEVVYSKRCSIVLCLCILLYPIYPLRKRLRIRSVMSVNYHYITVLCPFNLLICFKCYNIV